MAFGCPVPGLAGSQCPGLMGTWAPGASTLGWASGFSRRHLAACFHLSLLGTGRSRDGVSQVFTRGHRARVAEGGSKASLRPRDSYQAFTQHLLCAEPWGRWGAGTTAPSLGSHVSAVCSWDSARPVHRTLLRPSQVQGRKCQGPSHQSRAQPSPLASHTKSSEHVPPWAAPLSHARS